MPRSPYFWRLFLSLAGLVALALVLAWGTSVRWIRESDRARIEDDLRERAVLVRDFARGLLETGYDAAAQDELRQLSSELATRITVVQADGRVAADSNEDPRIMDGHGERPEIRAARETRAPAFRQRHSATVGEELMYLAYPLEREGGELVGFVRTALPVPEPGAGLGPLRAGFALAAGVALLLALGIALVFARRLTGSLSSLTHAAEAIAAGAFHERVRSTETGELGRLARAFDAMAEELERRVDVLTTERNQSAAILAGMVEGVVAIDREERVVHMNQVAARLLRSARPADRQLRIWEATRRTEVRELLAEAMRTNGPVQGELNRRGGDGRAIEMHAGPLTSGRGELVGAVLVLNDVTELRHLEAVRRDFVANVSHELKTPLTAIRGMIETILDDPQMQGEIRQRFLERIEEQTRRLTTLVTDLLTLSRLESESSRRAREAVDLRAVVEASLSRLRGVAEGKGLRLETALEPDTLWVLGDEEELQQMVDNLVDNAVKYTPEGGRVAVRLRAEPGGGEGAAPASCLLEVDDTGIGIEPRHQERIFERFYRVDKARSRELGGTGLGLSIVKHVAKESGGSVSLESRPGLGSTFRVRLPLAG